MVYLSSTYCVLKEERKAVYRTLRQHRHDVVAMEDYGATDERPRDKCLAAVADSDLYVGIFAWCYGYVPPSHTQSITELEFREAAKRGNPCLLFPLSEDAPWPRRDYVGRLLKTADELANDVGLAVSNAWQEAGRGDTGPRRQPVSD